MSFIKQFFKEIFTTRDVLGMEPVQLNSVSEEGCKAFIEIIDRSELNGKGSYFSNGSDFRDFDLRSRVKENLDLWNMIETHLPVGWFIGPIMGGHLHPIPGSLGSGEGWHRDSWFGQRKIIIYLTDVSEESGPFQYIPFSSSLHKKLLSFLRGKTDRSVGEVQDDTVITLLGKSGTAYMFDGTMIHRGKPPSSQERYALTAYLYSGAYDERAVNKKFLG